MKTIVQMKIPLYIIDEIIIRIQEFNSEIGILKSAEKLGSQLIIKTNSGIITVPVPLLRSQLDDPASIKNDEIAELSKRFIRIKNIHQIAESEK